MGKFKKEYHWLKSDMPFTALGRETGVYGMYCSNVRHKWYGIKGLIGLRITKKWGVNY